MGRSGLSSERKHSKKKSLKASSEGRRKKRSSRNKSKKLRRHDSSSSSSSDNDNDASTSSSLVSSSSSEDEYRSRRSRSHTRNEVKGSRKRSRKRSLSEESDKGSPPSKKRKGSKKKSDSHTKKRSKKIKKKKKPRRDAYISSSSSDSASCSTCPDGNSSSDEESSLRSREKKKDHRDSIRGRKGNRKNRSRSRSSSPSKLRNSSDDDIIEKATVENNSRRLKSIITVANSPENEEGSDIRKDELKEEIVYDYDDYPSCKSNDSNDGESKKELVDRFNGSPEKTRVLTSAIGEVNSSSSLKDNKSVSLDNNASRECVCSKEKESNSSGNIGSEVDNLESILRQKALENLSRFRGGLQRKAVVPVDNKHKSNQSGLKQANVQTPNRPPAHEQDSFSTMAVRPVPQPVVQRSRFTWRRDPSITPGKEEKSATDHGTESGRTQAPAPKLNTANISSTPSVEKKIKDMENTSDDIGGIETNEGQKATADLETKEGSSKEQQNETNNSQFEKKTMSVMRGGEMVQVSYKVYIPTRAPALARRQLKR